MAYHIYDKDVKQKLGEKLYQRVLDAVKSDKIDDRKIHDFASAWSPTIRGNHIKRTREKQIKSDIYEMKQVLSDCYADFMYDMSQKDAQERVIDILESDCDLKSLNLRQTPDSPVGEFVEESNSSSSEDGARRQRTRTTVYNKNGDVIKTYTKRRSKSVSGGSTHRQRETYRRWVESYGDEDVFKTNQRRRSHSGKRSKVGSEQKRNPEKKTSEELKELFEEFKRVEFLCDDPAQNFVVHMKDIFWCQRVLSDAKKAMKANSQLSDVKHIMDKIIDLREKRDKILKTVSYNRGHGEMCKCVLDFYEIHKELTKWIDRWEFKTLQGKNCENDLDLQIQLLDSLRSARKEKDGEHLFEKLKAVSYSVSQIITNDDSFDNIQNVMRKNEERYNTVKADILKTTLSLEDGTSNKRHKQSYFAMDMEENQMSISFMNYQYCKLSCKQ